MVVCSEQDNEPSSSFKRREISSVAEKSLASHYGLCSVELFSSTVSCHGS